MTTSPSPLLESLRPWKLFTLVAGIALLVIGAQRKIAPDRDIPISFIVALLAYLTAPWSLRALLQRRWKLLPLALLGTWFAVDGCYALYWNWRDRTTASRLPLGSSRRISTGTARASSWEMVGNEAPHAAGKMTMRPGMLAARRAVDQVLASSPMRMRVALR
jgi:hypothetical protein